VVEQASSPAVAGRSGTCQECCVHGHASSSSNRI
jgi:hypothetical protein